MNNLKDVKINNQRHENEHRLKAPDELLAYLNSLKITWPVYTQLAEYATLLDELDPHANAMRHYKDVIILGTGGSSLGGQALYELVHDVECIQGEPKPTLHFVDNIDALKLKRLLAKLEPQTTGVITISKSGNTAETLLQTLNVLQQWSETHFKPKEQMCIITETRDNGMMHIATTYSIPVIAHPQDIGGRFSVFTAVGLLPALIAGIDCQTFCRGALDAFENALSSTPDQSYPVLSAYAHHAFLQENIDQLILFAYSDYLKKFCDWFCQLWAESLGKKNGLGKACGTTPIRAIGAVDQHSQLQLYLDGPRNKYFRFYIIKENDYLPVLQKVYDHSVIAPLHQRSIGQLMLAEQQATIDTLKAHQRPVSVVEMKYVNAHGLGALMMQSMLETLLTAQLWDVNPFDQPAVEEGKKLAMTYLAKMGAN